MTSATREASFPRSGPDPGLDPPAHATEDLEQLLRSVDLHLAWVFSGDVVATTAPLSNGTSPHWDITFGVEDADASVARASELKAEVVVEPFDAPWVRAAVLRDPDGVAFTVSQFIPPEPG